MGVAAQGVTTQRQRLLLLQLGVGVVCAGFFFFHSGQWQALSALYGSGLCIVSAFLLGGGVARVANNGAFGAWHLYGGAVARFVLVLVGLAVGMGILKLDPLAVLVGFVAAQLAFPFIARREGRKPAGTGS